MVLFPADLNFDTYFPPKILCFAHFMSNRFPYYIFNQRQEKYTQKHFSGVFVGRAENVKKWQKANFYATP